MSTRPIRSALAFVVSAIARCGGAPAIVEPGIELGARPPMGARYDVVLVYEAAIPRGEGRVRSIGRGR